MSRTETSGLKIASVLHDFVAREAAPDSGLSPRRSGPACGDHRRCTPRIRDALRIRDEMQAKIDAWQAAHKARPSMRLPMRRCCARSAICCLSRKRLRWRPKMSRSLKLASLAGPQLVVPLSNGALCAQRRQCALGGPL